MTSIRLPGLDGDTIEFMFTTSYEHIDRAHECVIDFVAKNNRDPDFIVMGHTFAYRFFQEWAHSNPDMFCNNLPTHGDPAVVIVPDPFEVAVCQKALDEIRRIDWRKAVMQG